MIQVSLFHHFREHQPGPQISGHVILKYGTPDPDDEEKWHATPVRKRFHVLQIGAFWIPLRVADIVYSAKKIRSESLLEAVEALCFVLETAERNDSRVQGIALE